MTHNDHKDIKDDYRKTGCHAIDKSLHDFFTYVLQLRTGIIIQYSEASLSDDRQWLHLEEATILKSHLSIWSHLYESKSKEFARGMDVRISDIVWAADCPEGS